MGGLLILPGSGHKKAPYRLAHSLPPKETQGLLALSCPHRPHLTINSIPPRPHPDSWEDESISLAETLGFILEVSHTSPLHPQTSKFKREFQAKGGVISLL